MGLNVRVIKLEKGFFERDAFKCVLTEGYQSPLTEDIKALIIDYCPFCSKRVAKFYYKDEFVNEDKHYFQDLNKSSKKY